MKQDDRLMYKSAKWTIILSGGQEFELDEHNANKLARMMSGVRGNASFTVESGPSIGSKFRMDTIAALVPKRTKAEEKQVIEAQKEEQRKKLIRIQNAEEKNKSFVNAKNSAIDICDVLHKLQIDMDDKGNEIRRFFDENIVPRYQNIHGRKVYFPVCTKCGWRGQLLKPASIKSTFEMSPDEVVEWEGKEDEDK